MTKIINIAGIDGSGKSTLAQCLTKELLDRGVDCGYVYCQFFAKLLYPFKLIAKRSVMKETDEFADYETYVSKKTQFSKKHRVLGTIYALMWLIDYSMQTLLKINTAVGRHQVVIIDRYIYDIVINLSITAAWPVEKAHDVLSVLFKIYPKPDIVIYLDLPEEVAFARKHDIQSIRYLQERRERYFWLSEKWHFEIIDATRDSDSVLTGVLERCCRLIPCGAYENVQDFQFD